MAMLEPYNPPIDYYNLRDIRPDPLQTYDKPTPLLKPIEPLQIKPIEPIIPEDYHKLGPFEFLKDHNLL